MERRELDRFTQYWDDLFQAVPEARAQAVAAMGEAMKQELDAQIQVAQLETDAKGNVKSWQELRLGSGGGYAAISPIKGQTVGSIDRKSTAKRMRQHTYRGKPVTSKQITGWLEKGHGARQANTARAYAWSQRRWGRASGAQLSGRSGRRYVSGRQFYSWTRLKAWDVAHKAADKVLSKIADEVEY